MENIFRPVYRELNEAEKKVMSDIKDAAKVLYDLIEGVEAGREVSIAKTKLEESVMWAVKAVTK